MQHAGYGLQRTKKQLSFSVYKYESSSGRTASCNVRRRWMRTCRRCRSLLENKSWIFNHRDQIPGPQPCPAESRDNRPPNHMATQSPASVIGIVTTKPCHASHIDRRCFHEKNSALLTPEYTTRSREFLCKCWESTLPMESLV